MRSRTVVLTGPPAALHLYVLPQGPSSWSGRRRSSAQVTCDMEKQRTAGGGRHSFSKRGRLGVGGRLMRPSGGRRCEALRWSPPALENREGVEHKSRVGSSCPETAFTSYAQSPTVCRGSHNARIFALLGGNGWIKRHRLAING